MNFYNDTHRHYLYDIYNQVSSSITVGELEGLLNDLNANDLRLLIGIAVHLGLQIKDYEQILNTY